jgi:hypothetical protein
MEVDSPRDSRDENYSLHDSLWMKNHFLARVGSRLKRGRVDGQTVAIKTIQVKGNSFKASMKTAIENEVLLLLMCHHLCVLQTSGFCEVEPRTASLVLELESCILTITWSMLPEGRRSGSGSCESF